MSPVVPERVDLDKFCVCGHHWHDHEAYEPPYVCGYGMTVEDPDGDCDCMDYDQAVALISAATVAELRVAREAVAALAVLVDHFADQEALAGSPLRRARQARAAYDQAGTP